MGQGWHGVRGAALRAAPPVHHGKTGSRDGRTHRVDDDEQEHPQLNCFASLGHKTNSWPASQKHLSERVHTDNNYQLVYVI